MCQSRLPSELVEEIIDLQCDDLPTLKTGCLVNSQWLTRCRHHLFYSLSLSVKETFDFLKLLEGNISIGLNVQELLVHAVAARFQLNYTPANQTELLFEVLDRLPNLRTLRLHQVVYCCPSDLSYCKPWQPRQKTVIRYLELRGLCGVAERIAYTLSLFAKVPVNELHLDAVTVLEPSFNADHESPRRLEFLKSVMSGWQVTSLRIDLYNPPFWLINLFRAILSVDSLRSLEVGETALAGSYAILFEQFGPSLDNLRFNMWDLKDDAIKESEPLNSFRCSLLNLSYFIQHFDSIYWSVHYWSHCNYAVETSQQITARSHLYFSWSVKQLSRSPFALEWTLKPHSETRCYVLPGLLLSKCC